MRPGGGGGERKLTEGGVGSETSRWCRWWKKAQRARGRDEISRGGGGERKLIEGGVRPIWGGAGKRKLTEGKVKGLRQIGGDEK